MKFTSTLVVAVGALVTWVAPAAADDWPQSGRMPDGSATSPETLGGQFTAGWASTLGAAPILTAPVLADGTLVVGDTAGKLQALRALTGAVTWTAVAHAGFVASPVIWNGRVMAASVDGTFSAFRASNGAALWNQSLAGQVHGSPTLWDGNLVLAVGFPANRIVRVAPADGRVTWTTAPRAFPDLVNGTPIIWNGEILEGSRGGRFDRLDLATGAMNGHLDAGGAVQGLRPVVVGGRAFMVTGGETPRLATLNLSTGATQLAIPIKDPTPPPATARFPSVSAVSSPIALGGRIAFQARFQYDLPGANPSRTTSLLREWLFVFDPATQLVSPLVPLGSLMVASPNAIPELGICSTPVSFLATPGASSALLIASASSIEAVVRVVDPARGAVVWSAALSGPSRAPLTVANAHLFVATDAGVVHAFRSEINYPPAAPFGLSPAAGRPLNLARPVLSWWAAMDPEGLPASYVVRVDQDGEILEDWQEEVPVAAGVTSVMLKTPLAEGHTYSFAVRARDAAGAWSEWSAPETFVAEQGSAVSIGGRPFDTIDEAVAAATAGDTIALGAGTLHLSSPLALASGVSLEGASAQATRIDASGLAAGIRIAAGTEAGASIRGLTVSGGTQGIDVGSARGISIRNVVLLDNKESGLNVSPDGEATLINATVVRNGTGVLGAGTVRVRNSLLTQNGTGLAAVGTGTITSAYNDLFANTVAPYDHVEHGDGDLAAAVAFVDAARGSFLLAAAQASTDKGDPAQDFSTEPAPNGGRVNLGAFGGTALAEPSPSPEAGGCGVAGTPDLMGTALLWAVALLFGALLGRGHRR